MRQTGTGRDDNAAHKHTEAHHQRRGKQNERNIAKHGRPRKEDKRAEASDQVADQCQKAHCKPARVQLDPLPGGVGRRIQHIM
jgi:hypothetical protein